MPLSVGIVGLPNVGKSTFFNAITNAGAEAQNYPFCTIEPNTGIVPVPDERLAVLAKMSASEKVVPATITCVDIAGLVKGASKGEGLGNKFLSHIREVSAIAHVVRCFEDGNVVHVSGKINPIDDIETINLELILADMEMCDKLVSGASKQLKAGDQEAKDRHALLERVKKNLEANKPVRSLEFTEEEKGLLKGTGFLTDKRVIYVANVSEGMLGKDNPLVNAVKEYADKNGEKTVVICAKIEDEISKLDSSERAEFLKDLGIKESGLGVFAKQCYSLLGLQTFLTTGPKETRAWTIIVGDTAPRAAGVIHTDFEKGFIRANIISYDDFVKLGGNKEAREKGLMRQEGKEYVMKDGDVVEFLFNV
ncbi:MAG TPA: redox-regulated ATPase YchF [Elusimicrobia bacterium]|nr:MAG: redox-regulated ATPase YchF [Elusimicrobia bacterium RIFOXYA12_FULL_49_49]OGS10364.1 MAG: redox-regulated ATPase YchF [Elusimicrobia bacterium RIFOXYB1_FULL_48_9]OGS16309.1 MAG: redox-regulated ATPase YchF [Elusimicrobia bacterium RIFOXYA2_FULL_47_53]OGS25853.1 MAG: redox-regulated ATPase YchF [Elusimicrobia bacterium RIFOXYB12_FULL_50_12]OGS31464.1 MAG: redox-regulated ATPase YchF [Elusimicrobia bacterium RIFOXYB2_FULL_46_23]HBU70538.1 redox-regulated ATPase YchF [Elusimicrobiota bact